MRVRNYILPCSGCQRWTVNNDLNRLITAYTSRGIVVFLGDMPLVPPSAAALLIGALDRGAPGAEMRHLGRPAHPVAFGSALFDDLRALRGDRGGRHLLSGRPSVTHFETHDAGAAFDIDRVEDLAPPEPWP